MFRYEPKTKAERDFCDWLAGTPMMQGDSGDAIQIEHDHDVTKAEAEAIANALGGILVTSQFIEFDRGDDASAYCADYLCIYAKLFEDITWDANNSGEISTRQASAACKAARSVVDGILNLSPRFRQKYDRRIEEERELNRAIHLTS